jgi:hypothetical protein
LPRHIYLAAFGSVGSRNNYLSGKQKPSHAAQKPVWLNKNCFAGSSPQFFGAVNSGEEEKSTAGLHFSIALVICARWKMKWWSSDGETG